MADEILNEVINEDVSALDEQAAMYEAKMAEKDAKYAALLRAYARGERGEETATAEPTPLELREHFESNVKLLMENNSNDYTQAKALLEINDYVVSQGNPSIFLPTDGTLTEGIQKSAEDTEALLRYAIEDCEGSDNMFRAITTEHLSENKSIYNKR